MMARNGGDYLSHSALATAATLQPGKFKLICGHYHISMANLLPNAIKIIVVRDPIARAVSELEYLLKRGIINQNIINTAAEQGKLPSPIIDNVMSRLLVGQLDFVDVSKLDSFVDSILTRPIIDDEETKTRAAMALAQFDYIGFTDQLYEFSRILSRELFSNQIKIERLNTTKQKRIQITKTLSDVIMYNNSVDVHLFTTAVQNHLKEVQSATASGNSIPLFRSTPRPFTRTGVPDIPPSSYPS